MSKKLKFILINIFVFLGTFGGVNILPAQAASVTCNSATVSAFVAINNNPANAWFEWGPTEYFGNSTLSKTFYTNSLFSQLIGGLTDGTTYYYRLIVSNDYNHLKTIGPVQSFKTLKCSMPSVGTNTLVATNISNTSANINGFVSSNGNTIVNAWFKWGIDSNLPTKQIRQTLVQLVALIIFII